MSDKLWKKFFECLCHTEGVMLSYEWEDDFPHISLAMFRNGFSGELSWKERFRWCWNIIKNGRPFLDEVMIDQETAKELGEALIEFSKKEVKND